MPFTPLSSHPQGAPARLRCLSREQSGCSHGCLPLLISVHFSFFLLPLLLIFSTRSIFDLSELNTYQFNDDPSLVLSAEWHPW